MRKGKRLPQAQRVQECASAGRSIIEYTRQAKEEGLRNKFIGKNFVFDERMAERITDDVIAKCHTCGTSCDTHVNCANPTCNILMIQCDACKTATEGTCGDACHAFVQLPEEEQRERRKGTKAWRIHDWRERPSQGSRPYDKKSAVTSKNASGSWACSQWPARQWCGDPCAGTVLPVVPSRRRSRSRFHFHAQQGRKRVDAEVNLTHNVFSAA